MAIEPTPDTLLRIQTEINIVHAQLADIAGKVQARQLVELHALETATTGRAHRLREQLLTAPARHAALIAAREGLEPARLNAGLVNFVRATLKRIAEGPATP